MRGDGEIGDGGPGDSGPRDGGPRRRETPAEKQDRNWNDLLQELRVMQTGTQIVTAFLVTLPFQTRFEELAGELIGWYVVLLVSAVLLTVLMLLPVAIHRRFFGQHVKDRTVQLGHQVLRICLAGMGLVLVGCVGFITHALIDPGAAWWITGCTAAATAILLVVLPRVLRPVRA